MGKPRSKTVLKFLEESNAIEGEYGIAPLADACVAWEYLMQQEELTAEVILKTHGYLMATRSLDEKWKGAFRTCAVWIGGHEATAHTKIENRIKTFCELSNDNTCHWKWLHVLYEDIHPFADGNGRTGRMFMNWYRLKKLGLPLLVIKADERQHYYEWFRNSANKELP